MNKYIDSDKLLEEIESVIKRHNYDTKYASSTAKIYLEAYRCFQRIVRRMQTEE